MAQMLVPRIDVQELKCSKVPERFIRDHVERPNASSSQAIPVIDFSKLCGGDTDEMLKFKLSCQEWGFFQLINHEVDVELLDRVEKVVKEVFMLPLEEKMKYAMQPGIVQGYGQAFVFSEDQKLDWCNMFALALEPPSFRKPALWPKSPSDFGEAMEAYSRAIGKLCRDMLKCIAISLDCKESVFEDIFGEVVHSVRMNYYPPCPRPDLVLGLSPHSDGSGLTVLQQGKDDPVGLHVLKDDTWIPVQPMKNALVINIGDTIEVLTNGKYKSVEHRAVTNKEKDRISLVTFYAPSYAVELGPMEECVDESNPCKFRRYIHGEYSRHYVTNKLQGKKTLDFAKINYLSSK